MPALPVSLVASAMLAGGEHGLSSLELKGAVFALMRRLTAAGAHVHIPRHDQEYAVDVGLRMLMLRHLVRSGGGRLPAPIPRRRRCSPSTPTPSPTCCLRMRRQALRSRVTP